MKIIELHESVTESNEREAESLRDEMKERKILLVNLMSSPGSGKTTLLSRLIEDLQEGSGTEPEADGPVSGESQISEPAPGKLHIGVMEADIASDVDAVKIGALGARAIQAHTDGMCHMDAGMTRRALEEMGADGLDIIFLENVGNLICPAEFDTGAGLNIMILSVPEGDDKPLKYPLMFEKSDVLVITKMDTRSYFDFDLDACTERVKRLNPDIQIFPVSAKTGDGCAALEEYLLNKVHVWKG